MSIFNATGPFSVLEGTQVNLGFGIGPGGLNYDGLTKWFGSADGRTYTMNSCYLDASGRYYWLGDGGLSGIVFPDGVTYYILTNAMHPDGDDRVPVFGNYSVTDSVGTTGTYDLTIVEGACNTAPTPNLPLPYPRCNGGIANGTPVSLVVTNSGLDNGTYLSTWETQCSAAFFTLPSGVKSVHCGVNGWFVNDGTFGAFLDGGCLLNIRNQAASGPPISVVFKGFAGAYPTSTQWVFHT